MILQAKSECIDCGHKHTIENPFSPSEKSSCICSCRVKFFRNHINWRQVERRTLVFQVDGFYDTPWGLLSTKSLA